MQIFDKHEQSRSTDQIFFFKVGYFAQMNMRSYGILNNKNLVISQ